jgi:hypothetical protein
VSLRAGNYELGMYGILANTVAELLPLAKEELK